MASDKLTNQQRAFVAEYVKDRNGTQAAIRAGYAKGSAHVQASRLLKNDKIQAYIQDFLNEYAMSAAEVLYHLTDIARGSYSDFLNSMGAADASTAKGNGKAHLIKKVRTRTILTDDEEIHEVEIEPYDRLKALDLLAKYHQLTTTTRVEVSFEDQVIEAIRTGAVTFEALAEEFDEDLATQFFTTAGVPVQTE